MFAVSKSPKSRLAILLAHAVGRSGQLETIVHSRIDMAFLLLFVKLLFCVQSHFTEVYVSNFLHQTRQTK